MPAIVCLCGKWQTRDGADFLAALEYQALGLATAPIINLALGRQNAITAFTYERDLDHPVTAEVEQTIRSLLEALLTNQGLEGVLVNPGLDHDGDPVLFVHLKFRLVESGINPRLLSDSAISLRRALWAMGERRFPHLRYDFHDDQRILGTENW